MFSAGQHLLLWTLTRSGPTSRAALAGLTGLSKPSVTALARGLIDGGVLVEDEPRHGLGRPSTPLALRPDAACLLGASLRERDASLVLSDLGGTALVRRRLTSEGVWTPEGFADAVADALPSLRRQAGLSHPPAGAGIAVPGFVDGRNATCIHATRLGWRDIPLAALLQARLSCPVRLENDAHALARGMQVFGPMRGVPDFSLLAVDGGIGSGHVVAGRLLRGFNGGAGELAHATVRPGGEPCRCGKRGCLDTIASLAALAEAASRSDLPPGPEALEAEAHAGNARAVRLLHDAGAALGLAASQMIQTLDPGAVIVGLHPALAAGVYGAALLRTVAAETLPGFAGSPSGAPVRFVEISETAWAEGAAGVAAHRFLVGETD